MDNSRKEIILRKKAPLKNDSAFYIIAHRGGGRNSDYLSVSENSLPMIKMSEAFGANSIEIDVRLTRDNIPILYHDEEFNSRLVIGEFLVGPVGNFPLSHIRTFGRLLNGELIPTLKEAMDVILYETNLKLVWLDVKDPGVIDIIVPLIKEYRSKAVELKKRISFVVGISTSDMKNKYLSNTEYKQCEVLSELSPEETRILDAGYWAPRWTLGSLSNEIKVMHNENKKVFFWTMDDRLFINKYLHETNLDGILTNYPAILTYEFYFK